MILMYLCYCFIRILSLYEISTLMYQETPRYNMPEIAVGLRSNKRLPFPRWSTHLIHMKIKFNNSESLSKTQCVLSTCDLSQYR